ncbi:uncharacterized protein [Lepeophtheirus salmonis]|uniref:uncharacterized protein n=1 Tax=Lepeophtheirus salmonis TaxID=72036 RepID=UPI001AE3C6BF|nr:uncharacterized protein LOC121128010 [Lepeophtheirus salmonis]
MALKQNSLRTQKVFLLFISMLSSSQTQTEENYINTGLNKSNHSIKTLALKKSNRSRVSLTKFFQEPELGETWYSPYGPVPVFPPEQKNGTIYSAQLGSTVLLDCQVTALERDLVSWFRKDTEFTLLTVGFEPHSSENRFVLDFKAPHNYRLRIGNVQWSDSGIYQCQISTHPPQVTWVRLELIRPRVHLLDGDFQPIRDLHYDSGSKIDLICRVLRPPMYRTSVVWTFNPRNEVTNDSSDNYFILNQDTIRGGVKILTGMEEVYLISRLSMVHAKTNDTGNYTCSIDRLPSSRNLQRGLSDTIGVYILRGQNTEAIQFSASIRLESHFICISLMYIIICNNS